MLGQPEWLYIAGQTGRNGIRVPLSGLFKYGADHHPTRTAIADGQTSYTFLDLERGAQRIAATMHDLGVRQGDRVAILAEKVALLPMLAGAIWKLGAVYVPLDADSPPMRLHHMIKQLAPAAVLGKAERLAACQLTPPSISFESLASTASAEIATTRDAECDVEEDDLAYIIFTSGSTGAPKGVMVSHGSVLDYFFNHNQVLRFTPDSRVFSFSPFHFDVSIEDTLLPLSVGAFVYQFRGAPLGALVYRLLTRERITHLIAVSTILSLITPAVSTELPHLEMVMTGGEVCDPKVINQWKHRMPYLRVINAYGPTEVTIVCLTHEIDVPDDTRRKAYPIGRPLQGVSIKVMGLHGELTRCGELGELWVGGTQVMKGYLSDPDETDKAVVICDGIRFYRTGDMCCLDEHGQVEFVGRNDEEVKIAGRRINLGEVRQAALTCPSTSGAAVGLVDIHGRREIAAIVIGEHGPEQLDRILEYLAAQLPAYMLPRVVASAQSGYVGKTGKTDEKRLIALLNDACLKHGADRYVLAPSGGFVSY